LKKVSIEKAVGMTLAHDITEIVPGKKKDVAFRRGRVIEPGDLNKLLDLGKRYIYAFEGKEKGVHEEEAAQRIARAIMAEHMESRGPKEGKISIASTVHGLFYVNDRVLYSINRIKDVLLSVIPNRHPVGPGDVVTATRIIPLYVAEDALERVEAAVERWGWVIKIRPFRRLKAGLVVTGSEVVSGRVADGSSAVVEKLKGYGLEVIGKTIAADEVNVIKEAIEGLLDAGADLVVTTAGLSVDPDDVTKEGIEATGAKVLFYGTPVFPGAMFLAARLNGKYILGAPACVYYNRYTALDVVLPRILAGEHLRRDEMVRLSYGGLCMQCDQCHYPLCFFGKGP
jgi:molybdenum cofactor synthesis domain-containing protein